MYSEVQPLEKLSQGDVIDGCTLLNLEPTESVSAAPSPIIYRTRVVILTQECDLQDARTLRVVVAAVRTCQEIVEGKILNASTIRDQLRRHLMPGWYFLPKAPDSIHLPESIVEFRDLHTVFKTHLEALATGGMRVCRIRSPWREHLSQHFAVTYMRIGLPEPYSTEI